MKKPSLQTVVRARLREWTAGLTHQAMADYFHVNRSSISKLLGDDGPSLTLDHLEGFAFLVQRSASEMVTEPGSLWQEVKPLEAQLLRVFRQMTEMQRMSLLAVLDRSAQQATTRRQAKRGRAELTDEQQLVVDLYARSNEQARSGILKTLRSTARKGDEERLPDRTSE